MNTKIEAEKLLEILKTNRKEHRAIFEEAVEGYRKKAQDLLNQNLDLVKANKNHRVYVHLDVPVDHTNDYDRVIKMVEMSMDDYIVLQESDFKSYVMDDWQWTGQFYASNSVYSEMAGAKLEAMKAAGDEEDGIGYQ